jgi:hypothetical protein
VLATRKSHLRLKWLFLCTGSAVFSERQDAGSGYVQDVRYFARGMDAGSDMHRTCGIPQKAGRR